jgi:hypothetical protein
MVRKKKYWYHRWREQHPLLQMYLTKEQYNMVKSIADSQNKAMKDVVLEAINKLTEFEKWKREYELRIAELSKELRDKESEVLGLRRKEEEYKARLDKVLGILNNIYTCISKKSRDLRLCKSVCIDVKKFCASLHDYRICYDNVDLDVDNDCLKKLGL